MTTLTVAEVLDRAADLIEPEGAWTANRAGMEFAMPSKGPTCMGFAIERVAKGSDLTPYFQALYPVLPTRHDVRGVIDYNDAPERTQAEVVAKLRQAAALAREQS